MKTNRRAENTGRQLLQRRSRSCRTPTSPGKAQNRKRIGQADAFLLWGICQGGVAEGQQLIRGKARRDKSFFLSCSSKNAGGHFGSRERVSFVAVSPGKRKNKEEGGEERQFPL